MLDTKARRNFGAVHCCPVTGVIKSWYVPIVSCGELFCLASFCLSCSISLPSRLSCHHLHWSNLLSVITCRNLKMRSQCVSMHPHYTYDSDVWTLSMQIGGPSNNDTDSDLLPHTLSRKRDYL